ncbi:methionine ABC transporter permease [Treponema sp.]|uniref:methionine ABC transporter permease n=1 Tax=Treponema sp. TaxID=166 RepID=UPI00298D6882|nr:methionine ABC transporter permease [Treponema sp.]
MYENVMHWLKAKFVPLVVPATVQTLEMVFFATLFAIIIGLPLGVLLYVTDRERGIKKMPVLNQVINRIIDIFRSVPFLVLMIVLFPLCRIIVGKAIGTEATIIPLTIAAAPFVARLVETALKEIDPGVILASQSMGSTNTQIIFKVLIPECMPALVDGVTMTIINLIGYSAMAGAIGGGGLGDLAIRYGYQRFQNDVLIASVVVILILVGIIQIAGTRISTAMMKKR